MSCNPTSSHFASSVPASTYLTNLIIDSTSDTQQVLQDTPMVAERHKSEAGKVVQLEEEGKVELLAAAKLQNVPTAASMMMICTSTPAMHLQSTTYPTQPPIQVQVQEINKLQNVVSTSSAVKTQDVTIGNLPSSTSSTEHGGASIDIFSMEENKLAIDISTNIEFGVQQDLSAPITPVGFRESIEELRMSLLSKIKGNKGKRDY